MYKNILFIRPEAYPEKEGYIVDVFLNNDEGQPDLIRVDIGKMPSTLASRDPVMVNHVRSCVVVELEKVGFETEKAGAMVATYFEEHFPVF